MATILLVDDVAMNRDVARWCLAERGHCVTEAGGGLEAVQLAASQDFDVVMMDLRMPDIDGVEATRRICRIAGARGQVPIIAVTASALGQQIVESQRAGMVAHLVKPFSPRDLVPLVERVAGRTSPAFDADTLAQLAPHMSSADMERHAVDRLLQELLGT